MLPQAFHLRMLTVSITVVFFWLILVYLLGQPFYAGAIFIGAILGLSTRPYFPQSYYAPVYTALYTIIGSQFGFVLLEFQVVSRDAGLPWHYLFTNNFISQFVDENMQLLSAEKLAYLFGSALISFFMATYGKFRKQEIKTP
jgi:hypothetical protein